MFLVTVAILAPGKLSRYSTCPWIFIVCLEKEFLRVSENTGLYLGLGRLVNQGASRIGSNVVIRREELLKIRIP